MTAAVIFSLYFYCRNVVFRLLTVHMAFEKEKKKQMFFTSKLEQIDLESDIIILLLLGDVALNFTKIHLGLDAHYLKIKLDL